MKMKRFYYAMYDFTVKRNNPSYGFCNAKKAVAFETRKDRDKFLADRSDFDFSAKVITRKQAMRMLEQTPNSGFDYGLPIYNSDYMVVLKSSTSFGCYKVGQVI